MRTAEETAYEAIIGMILSRSYAPGDRLVESELAEALKLSRTPIRNVLRQLSAEGLLEVRGNKGCYIPSLSPEDMAMVFRARAHLEGKAAMEAAYCRTEEDISTLKELLAKEKVRYEEGDKKGYAALNDQFHLFIAKMCGNKYIEKFTRQVFWRTGLYIFYFDRFYVPPTPDEVLRDPSKSISCCQHDEILNAIVVGDGSLAENVIRSHIYTTYSKIVNRAPYDKNIIGINHPFI